MSSTNTYTKQQWIAEQAREHPNIVFTTLHRHLDLEWMPEAHRRTRKDGAAGIDGVTATDYEKDLEANLLDLLGDPGDREAGRPSTCLASPNTGNGHGKGCRSCGERPQRADSRERCER